MNDATIFSEEDPWKDKSPRENNVFFSERKCCDKKEPEKEEIPL